MIAVFSFVAVLIMSLTIVRIASVALQLTGLSRELARFQARSAWTGAGFTTAESEKVVGHPVRRRIIMLLMLMGNAGLLTMVVSLMATVAVEDQPGSTLWRILALSAGLLVFWFFATSKWIDRYMSRVIRWALGRWTKLEVRDYVGLLHLSKHYAVIEMTVQDGDWLADRSLAELKLSEEGVLVLGVEAKDGTYVGAPRGQTTLRVGDTILLYGRGERLKELDDRPAGWEGALSSVRARAEQQEIEREEKVEEETVEEETVEDEAGKDDDE